MAETTNQKRTLSPKEMFTLTICQHLFMIGFSCILCYFFALKVHAYPLLPPEEERREEENRFSEKNIQIRVVFIFNLLHSWHHLRNLLIGRIITPFLYLLFSPLTYVLNGFLYLLKDLSTDSIITSFRTLIFNLQHILSSKLELGTFLISQHNNLVYNIITPTLWPIFKTCVSYLYTAAANRGAIFSGSSGMIQSDKFQDLIYISMDVVKHLVNTVFYALPVACFFVITLLPSHLINEEGVEEYLKMITTSLFSPEETIGFRVFKILIILAMDWKIS